MLRIIMQIYYLMTMSLRPLFGPSLLKANETKNPINLWLTASTLVLSDEAITYEQDIWRLSTMKLSGGRNRI